MVCIAEENSLNQLLDACLSPYKDLWSRQTMFPPVNDNWEEATCKLPLGVRHEEKHFEHLSGVKTSCEQ
jgi:hypothetical protein